MLSLFSLTRCLGIECSLEGRKVGISGEGEAGDIQKREKSSSPGKDSLQAKTDVRSVKGK